MQKLNYKALHISFINKNRRYLCFHLRNLVTFLTIYRGNDFIAHLGTPIIAS